MKRLKNPQRGELMHDWAREATALINYLAGLTGDESVIVEHVGPAPTIRLAGRVRSGLLGKADSNISALTSNTPGSGTVSIWIPSATTSAWVDSGENVTAYNFSLVEVTAGLFIMMKLVSGRWLVDFESCAV